MRVVLIEVAVCLDVFRSSKEVGRAARVKKAAFYSVLILRNKSPPPPQWDG